MLSQYHFLAWYYFFFFFFPRKFPFFLTLRCLTTLFSPWGSCVVLFFVFFFLVVFLRKYMTAYFYCCQKIICNISRINATFYGAFKMHCFNLSPLILLSSKIKCHKLIFQKSKEVVPLFLPSLVFSPSTLTRHQQKYFSISWNQGASRLHWLVSSGRCNSLCKLQLMSKIRSSEVLRRDNGCLSR